MNDLIPLEIFEAALATVVRYSYALSWLLQTAMRGGKDRRRYQGATK
jgi:hypothetical protein